MSLKSIINSQYRDKVDQVARKLQGMAMPPEGWLRTARKALCMSAAQLARRQNKTRALVSRVERKELEGSVTLKTMQSMAAAMNCRFVYAIVPEGNVDDILEAQAYKKARQLVEEGSQHMALEQQSLSNQQIAFEIERLKQEMLKDIPSDFWDNES